MRVRVELPALSGILPDLLKTGPHMQAEPFDLLRHLGDHRGGDDSIKANCGGLNSTVQTQRIVEVYRQDLGYIPVVPEALIPTPKIPAVP